MRRSCFETGRAFSRRRFALKPASAKAVCTASDSARLDPKCEHQINVQIGMELSNSHAYLAMAAFCMQSSIALPGMAGFCLAQSEEERVHAGRLMAIQLVRGGAVVLQDVQLAIDMSNWSHLDHVLNGALSLEQTNLGALLELRKVASDSGDHVLADSVISKFLSTQYDEIHELKTLVRRLRLAGDCTANSEHCTGAYILDLQLGKEYPYDGKIRLNS